MPCHLFAILLLDPSRNVQAPRDWNAERPQNVCRVDGVNGNLIQDVRLVK